MFHHNANAGLSHLTLFHINTRIASDDAICICYGLKQVADHAISSTATNCLPLYCLSLELHQQCQLVTAGSSSCSDSAGGVNCAVGVAPVDGLATYSISFDELFLSHFMLQQQGCFPYSDTDLLLCLQSAVLLMM